MDRDPYDSPLLNDGPLNGLAYPPCCVGAELIASAVIKFGYGLHEPQITLLNEVRQAYARILKTFGNTNDQP